MSIRKQYIKEIKDETNYCATWLPILRVSPGDVGRIIDFEYQPLTTLRELGIAFQTTKGAVKAWLRLLFFKCRFNRC